MKPGLKTLSVALLVLGLILVNYLASRLPLRADATAEHIYTLSDGTKSLLSKIEEPIVLDYYFSRSANGLPIQYKNYAERIREMLRQYVRASGGKITLNVVDPRPDTQEEERAGAAGLQPQRLPTGETFYFGLVAIQADQQKEIPSFTPQRESFLEYDISELLYSVQTIAKKKLGLITSLPLQAPPMNPMMMQQRQRPTGQLVADEWAKTFEIVPVEATATSLPDGLDVLAVIHPQNLTPKLEFAIDQFLLAGKPVFVAVDPASQYFRRMGGQNAMFGGPQPNVSSDLPMLKAWGVNYNPQNVVGDLDNATSVQTGPGGVVRYPIWLSLTEGSFSKQATMVGQLKSLLFVESGSLSVTASGRTVTPLIETSANSGDLPAMTLQFAQPDEVARQITPSGKKTLAVLITGKFTTAFPDGAPKAEPPADANAKEPKPPEPAAAPALKDSTSSSTLFVIADTDWLFDDYSVERFNFLGTQAARPLNDNLAFASNSLEFLGGSKDLISLRGKGSSVRPFTVVRNLEIEAQKRYQDQLSALESRLSDVQKKLSDLQGKSTEGNRLIATPEVQKAIEDFQTQQATMRGERREIRKALREDIEFLENSLLAINLTAPVILVILFGFWFQRRRHV
ncbi:MAG: Gldg family protein [Opitutaceae bacterium]|nr:Gldg family protein [Opitutaceae bacterium]